VWCSAIQLYPSALPSLRDLGFLAPNWSWMAGWRFPGLERLWASTSSSLSNIKGFSLLPRRVGRIFLAFNAEDDEANVALNREEGWTLWLMSGVDFFNCVFAFLARVSEAEGSLGSKMISEGPSSPSSLLLRCIGSSSPPTHELTFCFNTRYLMVKILVLLSFLK